MSGRQTGKKNAALMAKSAGHADDVSDAGTGQASGKPGTGEES